MSEEPSNTEQSIRIRGRDWLIAGITTAVFLGAWACLPTEWMSDHTGGWGFLFLFVPMAGVAALLASLFLFDKEHRVQDHPAIWLGIQVLFWNPITYRAVLAVADAAGLPDGVGAVLAWLGLMFLGGPTSLLGAALCRSPCWIAVYLTRAALCLFTTWIPLLPTLVFLHVLLFAEVVTWDRYGKLHRAAICLVILEQFAAFVWVFLFGQWSA